MNENTSRHGSAQILDERMTAATDKFEIVATERAADVITGREESWEGRVSSLMIPAVVLSPVKRGTPAVIAKWQKGMLRRVWTWTWTGRGLGGWRLGCRDSADSLGTRLSSILPTDDRCSSSVMLVKIKI